ncbi:bestrophin-like domain, partial [Mesorhizobium sp. P5_C1]
QKVVELRWILIEQSEGTIPAPLIAMLVAWLVLIFASFGFRAPRNAITVSTFVVSAVLIAGAIYLILDMDIPFSGPIQISPAPLQRALAELQR